MKELHLLGYASGVAGADIHSGDGPLVLQKSADLPYVWDAIIQPALATQSTDEIVGEACERLARLVAELVQHHVFFSVIGGDHTAAVGTWSGVYDALHAQGDLGLIWFDAHMDSHTPETTESGNIHGMPLAALLGHGSPFLTDVLHKAPKFKPQNVCLIGVRSFERGEAEFLKKLNVRIFFMEEVKQRGLAAVMHDAIELVSRNTIGYGFSFDLDGLDPADAPGVDVPEPDGVHAQELYESLADMARDPRLIATEIVEFDPTRDKDKRTEKVIVEVLAIIEKGKNNKINKLSK